ncbi:MAG: hypothetical protein HYS41_02695 [Candidatus Omnitrophica bacterium]|nr:hypothetical protein [Candidatus Omnitrophota bacterium]
MALATRLTRIYATGSKKFAGLAAGLLLTLGFAAGAAGEYQSRGKRDPFIALLTEEGVRVVPPGLDEGEETGIESLVLQGVVFDPADDSYALINGKIVRVNDDINGAKILAITPTAVTVLVEGQPHRLTLSRTREEGITESPTQGEETP